MKFLLIVSFLSIALISCSKEYPRDYRYAENGLIYNYKNDQLYTGKVIDTADVVIEFQVVNGKKNGRFVTYYLNGNVEKTGWIQSNLNEGEWQYFYPDGSLESSGHFSNDYPNGLWHYYYPDGSLKQSGNFKNGVQEGDWFIFEKDGSLRKYLFYQNGILRNTLYYLI